MSLTFSDIVDVARERLTVAEMERLPIYATDGGPDCQITEAILVTSASPPYVLLVVDSRV